MNTHEMNAQSTEDENQQVENFEDTYEIHMCSCCGQVIEDDDYVLDRGGDVVCNECAENEYRESALFQEKLHQKRLPRKESRLAHSLVL